MQFGFSPSCQIRITRAISGRAKISYQAELESGIIAL
jgi:hypothetical protein